MVLGYDGKDKDAPARRLAARAEHLNLFEDNYNKGIINYGVALLNDEGQMIGSMVICNFTSEEELKKQWLDIEPYIKGNVWEKIKITEVKTPPFIKE